MRVHVLIMTYNGSKFIKEVIESVKPLGSVFVYIDKKTTDQTKKIVKKTGVKYEHFEFVDFMDSRNYILNKHGANDIFRIFIDDSYLFKGNSRQFINELYTQRFRTSIGVRIHRTLPNANNLDQTENVSARITRWPRKYVAKIHEFIDYPAEYVMYSGYFEDLVDDTHLYRTLRRNIVYDLPELYSLIYSGQYLHRCSYFLFRTLILLYAQQKSGLSCFKHFYPVKPREILYWIIFRMTMDDDSGSEYTTNNRKQRIETRMIYEAVMKEWSVHFSERSVHFSERSV